MTVSALTQQQRQILHALHNAVRQYHQQIAQAQERLEDTLKQIQTEKGAAEQKAKRVYEQAVDEYVTRVLDTYLSMNVKEEYKARIEQARAELRTELLSATSKKPKVLPDAYDTNVIIEHIRRIEPTVILKTKTNNKKIEAILIPLLIIQLLWTILLCINSLNFLTRPILSIECIITSIGYIIMFLIILSIARKYKIRLSKDEKWACQDEINYLSALYYRWLELITNQAQSRNTEAQQAHQQAVEQIKQQFLNNLQQLRPTVIGYTTLADHTSPPWQSEAWQDWKPGALAPGVVRLGVFTLQQPDQLQSEPARVNEGEILKISAVRLGGGAQ